MGKSIIDRVQPGSEPLTGVERNTLTADRDRLAEGNLRLIQRLNRRGVQVDAGLEAITQFRTFLQDIGVITEDQRLAAEAMWEHNFNQQLKASMSQVQQMQAQQAQPGLVTPPQGIILPGN